MILDGLDEHGLGQNGDVLKIIRNQKMLNCGIIVSSRPHSTKAIELHFPAVVQVEGFDRNQAERFTSNFFKDENQIRKVMEFAPSGSGKDFPIQQTPILLSFFCFLVAEQEIDLSDRTISLGDIYTLLVKCLYKKFTNKKNIPFKVAEFNKVMKSVGKLAFKTLTSNNPLLRRTEVLEMIGDFAFEYGLFAGHEDIRLCTDPIADIYVTYAHRSLEEFFGSFGFIQALNEGKSVEDILGSEKPIFMVNPLVLRFCLSLLSSSDFDFLKKGKGYDKLTSCVAERIDTKVFNPYEVRRRYPAIDMFDTQLGRSKYQFFRDTLNKCKQVTTLHLNEFVTYMFSDDSELFSHIVGLMNRDFFNRLTKIIIGPDLFNLKETDDKVLTWSIDTGYSGVYEIMKLFLQKCDLSRNPQIYLKIDTFNRLETEISDITPLLFRYVKHLYIRSLIIFFCLVKASGEFSHCPLLTHLIIHGEQIECSVFQTLRSAIQSGKLPSPRRITLIECRGQGQRYDWPEEVKVTMLDDWDEAKWLEMFKSDEKELCCCNRSMS